MNIRLRTILTKKYVLEKKSMLVPHHNWVRRLMGQARNESQSATTSVVSGSRLSSSVVEIFSLPPMPKGRGGIISTRLPNLCVTPSSLLSILCRARHVDPNSAMTGCCATQQLAPPSLVFVSDPCYCSSVHPSPRNDLLDQFHSRFQLKYHLSSLLRSLPCRADFGLRRYFSGLVPTAGWEAVEHERSPHLGH